MQWRRGGWEREAPPTQVNPVLTDPTKRSATRKMAAPKVANPLAYDLDFGAASARWLLLAGALFGLATVACAAVIANGDAKGTTWVAQLIFAALFLWSVFSIRGTLRGRGVIATGDALSWRSDGSVHRIPWSEIGAVGVGTLPWFNHASLVHPEQREALEIFPADPSFPARNPALDRWRVEEEPPMPGLPGTRYRFPFPPFTRLPKRIEQAVQEIQPKRWHGRYPRTHS
ncbi:MULTISPECIES: hypothetical protein [unclassified Crossiella]|uniref:hypothetical protein n=1 Tax=unclassified Crossiella TaxID=2620835 RepID=UPI001FFEAEA1|nr:MULTISPECIES: hypothetical protein [unclassified Crossiella]MCK2243596.1 hypothetical protein [Crossiella sp. S99.2]MCK2257454.1 hypothetical protein [Crossiella sp. S99.1]